jgi:hypothetical protein
MDFSNSFLQLIAVVLTLLMALVAVVNWLNRRHGGFMRGWSGAVFISVCWIAAIALIMLKVQG